MLANRLEVRVITIAILLDTLALALAIISGYAWWSAQRGLTRLRLPPFNLPSRHDLYHTDLPISMI
jgi:uncharacterized iron-regulated membrane protein